MKRTIATSLVAIALGGCMVGPEYHRPDVKLPTSYPETLPAEKSSAAPEAVSPAWWTLFGDPALNDVVQSALANNRDIQLAVARIEEANANLRAVGAAFLPEIDVTGGGSRSAVAQSQSIRGASVSNSWRIGLASTFELDFWGRIRYGVDAARAAVLGARDAADVVRITTAGVTTQTYFAVRSLDAQIATTEVTLNTRTEALRLVRRRAEAGVASDLDVAQSEGAVVDASAQLKDLVRQRSIALHALEILTGRLDLALDRGDLMKLPDPALPPPDLPSTLLTRRPDIRQAEYQLVAANAQIGLARAALFPSISLTAAFGATSPALHALFDGPNRTWSFGGNLLGPLFDAGRRQALVEAEEARTRQAVVNYRQVVERSFREVADALVAVRQASAAEADLQTGVRAATNALRLANLRYEAGYSGFLEVLDAQRTLNNNQLALVRNRQTLLAADVDLMRALGGGWSPATGLPTAAAAQ